MRAARRSALALLVSLSIAPAARGALAFNFTWGPNIPAGDLVNVQTATTYAALQITNNFSDNVVLNVTVDGMPTGLGMSSAPLVGAFTNAQINAFLNADKTTPDDTTAVANLPAADQTGGTNYLLARGLAKGLGQVAAADPATDGTFSYGTGNSYTFDPNNRAQSGKFDFIGVAEHELTELMGRVCRVNSTGNGWRVLDDYRFKSTGVRSTSSADTNVRFSFNGGAAQLHIFNDPGNGGDLGDWASGQGNDAFNAFGGTNAQEDISTVDLQVMDVIGWNRIIPEPASATLIACAAVTLLARRRR